MTDGFGMQPGEIERTLARIEADLREFRDEARTRSHDLANTMNAQLGKVSVHDVQIAGLVGRLDAHAELIAEVNRDIQAVTATANKISGAGALLAVVAGFVSGWFKH
jgi:hypothetical protein